jgi:homoserine dehydrogenase
VETVFSETQLFVGKGAGDEPTGSAVLSDISALTYGYQYEYKKVKQDENLTFTDDFEMEIYVRYRDSKPEHGCFDSITEEYISPTHKYIIGLTTLQKILESELPARKDVSIIQV